jgi:hypothetical protein
MCDPDTGSGRATIADAVCHGEPPAPPTDDRKELAMAKSRVEGDNTPLEEWQAGVRANCEVLIDGRRWWRSLRASLIREPTAGYSIFAMSLIAIIKPTHTIS